jgi:ubiquinone/menaquinone biosynthesis C-methylase UbiE
MDNAKIKEQVRERYGNIAKQVLEGKRGGCCDPVDGDAASCCAPSNVIPADLLTTKDAIPQDIVSTSLGCGTPLEIAKLQPGETVLDLGSGGGLDCLYASRLVGATGHVIGIDMTPDMLALARKNAEKVGATNVEFRHGELEQMPVADNSIDVIISNCVINLAPDKERVFREAFRVLKPGGRVAISDMMTRVPMPELMRSNMQSWAACVSGAITEPEYIDKMRAAGFIEVEKIAGGENRFEMVYSAKIVARKP